MVKLSAKITMLLILIGMISLVDETNCRRNGRRRGNRGSRGSRSSDSDDSSYSYGSSSDSDSDSDSDSGSGGGGGGGGGQTFCENITTATFGTVDSATGSVINQCSLIFDDAGNRIASTALWLNDIAIACNGTDLVLIQVTYFDQNTSNTASLLFGDPNTATTSSFNVILQASSAIAFGFQNPSNFYIEVQNPAGGTPDGILRCDPGYTPTPLEFISQENIVGFAGSGLAPLSFSGISFTYVNP